MERNRIGRRGRSMGVGIWTTRHLHCAFDATAMFIGYAWAPLPGQSALDGMRIDVLWYTWA